jgi:hypothetical protein
MSTTLHQRHRVCPAAQRGTRHLPHLPEGCRCPVNAKPTHHFMKSLAVNGWPLRMQGRLLGASAGTEFRRILGHDLVERATALRVARLWDRLWDVPGPCPRTVAWAARCGWEAPDPVVVARLIAGTGCPATRAERDQAIRVMAAQGRSATAIVTRLRTSHHKIRVVTGRVVAA